MDTDNGLAMAQLGLNLYNTIASNALDEENLAYAKEYNKSVLEQQDRINALNIQMQKDVNAENVANAQAINQANIELMDRTNEQNKAIADANLQLQKDNLEYQKYVQDKTWEREDNSYQRTVEDMAKAGLNPLAMKGTNGAGAVVSTTAPQSTMNYQAPQNAQLPSGIARKVESAKIQKIEKANNKLQALSQLSDTIGSIQEKKLQKSAQAIQIANMAQQQAQFESSQKESARQFNERLQYNKDYGNAKNRFYNKLMDIAEKYANKYGLTDDIAGWLDKQEAKAMAEMEQATIEYYNNPKNKPTKGSREEQQLKAEGRIKPDVELNINKKDENNKYWTPNKDFKFY